MATASPYGKKEELYGYQTLYREIGYYISRLEQYQRSLYFFDEAIKKTPNDRRALMGRAWARSKACEYEGALDDIRKALGLDPDDLVMLAHKALNTYLNCEFEDGLVQNTRLIPRRKKPDYFTMGAMHCADAIENCLGERAGRPLRDHYKIIRTLAWRKNFEEQKGFQSKYKRKKKKKKKVAQDRSTRSAKKNKKKSVGSAKDPDTEEGAEDQDDDDGGRCASNLSIVDSIYSTKSEQYVSPPRQHFPYKPLQNYTSNIENYMAEKYLHTLYIDKMFLRNLGRQAGVTCPNVEGTNKILQLAKMGYKTVKYKQDLLRARRPFYFIKYQEATSSGALKVRQEEHLRRLRETTRRDADHIVVKMEEALGEKHLRGVLNMAEKLKQYCDSKSKKLLPDREKYLQRIYDCVCNAHFDLKRLNKAQYQWDQEKRIYHMLGLHLSREPSTDSVITQFKGVFVDWKKQISVYSERLRNATKPQEMSWLYHELARFHTELKQFDLARVFARKCINEAKRCGDDKWVINALVLTMRINIGQHSKNDAKSDVTEALQLAKRMEDEDLEEFMKKTKEVIDKVEFDDQLGPKVLQQREQKIVEMMAGDKMKDEAAHLFRMMQAMPAARRMSVMPGIKSMDEEGDEKKASRKQSIMPGAQQKSDYGMNAAPAAGRNKTSSLGTSAGTKGVGFVELIKFHIDDD